MSTTHIVGSRQSESEVVSPHTPRHHVTTTHLCGGDMWHQKTVNKYNNVLQIVTITTVWTLTLLKQHCVKRVCHSEPPDHLWLHPMCIPDTDHLNGNLLLNKENRENLESAGELPETDSRMYQTLKRMCHNTKTPILCHTLRDYYRLLIVDIPNQ